MVSNASWNRAGKGHANLHRNEVQRQKKDYSVTEADRVLTWQQARDMMLRLPVNKIVPAGGSAASTPVRPLLVEANSGMKVPVDSHLGNRIAQFLTQVVDEKNDPFDGGAKVDGQSPPTPESSVLPGLAHRSRRGGAGVSGSASGSSGGIGSIR